MKKIIVVGGGAAGMMAAISAARAGAAVTLLEKNEKTGKKLFITGKGRCNLTNACGQEAFFDHMVSNGKFLYSAYYRMDNRQVMDFFEKAGCRLKVERGERVFPSSDHSFDVIDALKREMSKGRVKVCLHTQVTEILTRESSRGVMDVNDSHAADGCGNDGQGRSGAARTPCFQIAGVRLADGRVLEADGVILATGGRSYDSTGSTGDGYRFAEKLGHTLAEPRPALVPLTVKEGWCMEMQGLSLKNVSVLLKKGKKKIYQGFGEMLFTHFGVSGPLILSASSYYVKKYYGMPVQLLLDLKPALSAEQLDRRLLRDFDMGRDKQFKNILGGLLPSKMIPVMVQRSGIPPEKKGCEITKKEREYLISCLKGLEMTVTGTRGFQEAIVTQGGICVKEVNPATMGSKLVEGLYFAGEVLDLDAMTGGFNLQIAWSTGYLAGVSAAA